MRTFLLLLLTALLAGCQPATDSRGDRTDSSAMKAPNAPADGTSMPVAPAPKVPRPEGDTTAQH